MGLLGKLFGKEEKNDAVQTQAGGTYVVEDTFKLKTPQDLVVVGKIQGCIKEGDLVYGVYLGENMEVLNRPIQTEDDALKEFYTLLPDGSSHKGLKTEADGTISCRLTGADEQYQGTITFNKPQGTFTGYCAEVIFSSEVTAATGLTRIRYILDYMWPPTGFLSDILDILKK